MPAGLPVADYALLSDSNSAALVSGSGSVDWLCLPRFDSPSTFARLLDVDAGHWQLAPEEPFDARRRYLPDTLVLETQFVTPTGKAMATDALVFGDGERGHGIGVAAPHALVRVVEVTRGQVVIEATFAPRPEYGLVRPRLASFEGGLTSRGGGGVLVLSGPAPDIVVAGTATWRIEMTEGDRVAFALRQGPGWQPAPQPWPAGEIERRLADTVEGWQSWSAQHDRYDGPWRREVQHAARVIQGLTFAPTGAVIAAATTSLPETAGGDRNWDYRFAWTSCTALTSKALQAASCAVEAERLAGWLVATTAAGGDREGGVQAVHGVGGEHDLSERELTHLSGWRDSTPVRVGHRPVAAQLGIAGELIDTIHDLPPDRADLDTTDREVLCSAADFAVQHWTEPDQGIWETRGEPQHHLHSKLACWVALDRALSLADRLHASDARTAAWTVAREDIHRTILDQGWNPRLGAFTQTLGGDQLDAAVLLMATAGFLPLDDQRLVSTIDRIASDLAAPCGLLWRYLDDDGVDGDEPTYLACTYWLVEALAVTGRVDQATDLFERATAYANDVGLLAEEAEPHMGELTGNFPHVSSHVGLVNAANALGRAGVTRDDE